MHPVSYTHLDVYKRQANDILHTGYYHFNLYGINAYMENRIYRDFQRFGLKVSYKDVYKRQPLQQVRRPSKHGAIRK